MDEEKQNRSRSDTSSGFKAAGRPDTAGSAGRTGQETGRTEQGAGRTGQSAVRTGQVAGRTGQSAGRTGQGRTADGVRRTGNAGTSGRAGTAGRTGASGTGRAGTQRSAKALSGTSASGSSRRPSQNRTPEQRAAARRRQQELLKRKRRIQIIGIAAVALTVIVLGAVVIINNFGKNEPGTNGSLPNMISSTEEQTEGTANGSQETKDPAEADESGSQELSSQEAGEPEQSTAQEDPVSIETIPEEPAGGETVYATSKVNIRSIPDTSGEKLGQLEAGESIVRTADENGWSTVIYNGATAYISSEFLTASASQPETSAASQTSSMSKFPVHEGAWDLASLDNTEVHFGNAEDQRAANMVPTDWEFYENKWGQFNVDWIQDINTNTIYLTMDDGFGNDTTATVLDKLKAKNVKVVFFITKNFLDDRPDLVQRMIDEGHIIGNHTCTHRNMPSLGIEEETNEIMTLQNAMMDQFGYEMKLFRFPQGYYSDQSLGLVENLGLKSVFWSYAYNDYSEEQPEVEPSLERALTYLHPGAIYLLHASSSTNAEFLDRFIDGARERGFEFGIYPLEAN